LKILKIILPIFFISIVLSQDLYKPNNLSGRLVTMTPRLEWEAPIVFEQNQWLLNWDGSVWPEGGIGNSGGFPASYFQRLPHTELSDHVGKNLEMISLNPKGAADFQALVFEVTPGGEPDLLNNTNLILTSPIIGPPDYLLSHWNYVQLYDHASSNSTDSFDFSGDTVPSTYQISDNQKELWFGFRITNYPDGVFPMGIDDGPPLDSLGNMVGLCWDTDNGGSWNPADFDTCWVHTLMQNSTGAMPYNWATGLYVSDQQINGMHYKVYENGTSVAEVEPAFYEMESELEEIDLGPREFGEYEYFVTAVYDTFESEPTNTVIIDIFNSPPSDFSLLSPLDSSEISVTATDVINELSFVWMPSNDADGQSVSYNLEICLDNSPNPFCVDTTVENNSFQIQYNEFIVLMSIENGLNDMSWSVSASDSIENVTSLNGPFSFQLLFDFLDLSDEKVPSNFTISEAYPNPFNPTTNIDFGLPEDSMVDLIIYDILGRKIKYLVKSHQSAGDNSVQWNATNDLGEPVPAGLYFYTIKAGSFTKTKKMLLIK